MEVFQTAVSEFGGAFAAQGARLTFGGVGTAGLVTQSVSGNFNQTFSLLYELQARRVYYVAGRTEGTVGIQRVVGPRSLLAAYYERYGNVCRAAGNLIDFSVENTCEADVNAAYRAKYCVITSLQWAASSQDMVVNEGTSLRYSALEYNGD